MCKICKIDYPVTKEFYTTHNGVPRVHMCRSCHSHLLKKRYDEKRKQGYRLKMVKDEPKEEKENIKEFKEFNEVKQTSENQ